MITGEQIAEAMRKAGMQVQYFPLDLAAADRAPTTMGSVSLNDIAQAINIHAIVAATQVAAERDPDDMKVIELARDMHQLEGEVEIDDNAVISWGEDRPYIGAWVFIPNAGLTTIGVMNPEAPEDDEAEDPALLAGGARLHLPPAESEGGHCD